MKPAFRAVVLVSLFLAVPLRLAAQVVDENPGDHARFRWGGLRFTPGIAVTDVGIDNNVFNDAAHQASDTTAALGPAINIWTSLGRLRIAEKSSGQYLFFKEFDNQRSWNTSNELRLDLPLSRIKPFVAGSYVNTRQRPGFEIDSRARASTEIATIGTELRVSGKTTLVLSGTRTTMAFDQDETFFGTALAEALNRHSDTELLQVRYGLTPLTTFVLNGEASQDRFAHDSLRNADSISVRPGFEFKPFALIAGTVSVGFRHFNVLNDSIQDYQGLVAAVDARYTLTTSTQLTATVNRDIAFSYEEKLPYYTLTNAGLTVRQRISTAWDLVVRGASQTAAYRGLTAQSFEKPRTDHGAIFGLGVGYLVNETFRIGVDVNYFTRRSPLSVHSYDGLRVGASVSYGIAQ
jgi:putative beta-barrel porin BBP2